MSRAHEKRAGDRSVPGIGGPGSEVRGAEGQSALKLHAGIAVVATVLCAFVTGIFGWLGSIPLAVVFAVITVACLAALGASLYYKRRGRQR